jgi:hypothetical protein
VSCFSTRIIDLGLGSSDTYRHWNIVSKTDVIVHPITNAMHDQQNILFALDGNRKRYVAHSESFGNAQAKMKTIS